MIKALKMTGLILLILIGLLVLGTLIFTNFHPVFGGKPNESDLQRYNQSEQFQNGIFKNQEETSMSMGFKESMKLLPEFFRKAPEREPAEPLPVEKMDSLGVIEQLKEAPKLTWFGHSAFLLTLDGKTILLDPMFGDSPSPVSFLGSKRYSKELPLEIEKIPEIDLVIFSHDHYDHLDYGSVLKLKDKVLMWYVPLGLGNHLKKWGVPAENIRELDWWEESSYKDLNLACTPARHFSGRGLTDRWSTLWSSWVIQGDSTNIYFSGDSGYGPHFKEIGDKYGPFDLAMMECGQYNERWSNIHMMPEETIQAGLDVKSEKLMPIHWGAFTLALHPWKDPVERATKEAQRVNLPFITPKIGHTIDIHTAQPEANRWWIPLK